MIRPLLAALLLATTAPALAGPITFVGSFSNDTPSPMPNAACTVGQVLVDFNPGNSTAGGTSNLGAFGPSQTHCIAPGQPYAGTFSFDFGTRGVMTGSTAGFMTPTATTGVFNAFVTYTLGGGTGDFLGGTGTISGVGLLDRRPLRPLNDLALNGNLLLPGVPEPSSWAMLVIGFGAIGAATRHRARAPRMARA